MEGVAQPEDPSDRLEGLRNRMLIAWLNEGVGYPKACQKAHKSAFWVRTTGVPTQSPRVGLLSAVRSSGTASLT